MSEKFNYKTGTNGGANRFFDKGGDTLLVAGEGVGGRKALDFELLKDIWGFKTAQTGIFNDKNNDGDTEDFTITLQSNGVIRIKGDVDGRFAFTFDDDKAAQQFVNFLNEINEAGYLEQVLS